VTERWIKNSAKPSKKRSRTSSRKALRVGTFGFFSRWKIRRINQVGKKENNIMANFYCEYCGAKFPSVASLVNNTCPKHPSGVHRGKHKLYEGGEKTKYTCKHCGTQFSSIASLVSNTCPKHPDGVHKGKHVPALV
jgi:DNA-directed RNA polymerase subunit RPC12/RpoP